MFLKIDMILKVRKKIKIIQKKIIQEKIIQEKIVIAVQKKNYKEVYK